MYLKKKTLFISSWFSCQTRHYEIRLQHRSSSWGNSSRKYFQNFVKFTIGKFREEFTKVCMHWNLNKLVSPIVCLSFSLDKRAIIRERLTQHLILHGTTMFTNDNSADCHTEIVYVNYSNRNYNMFRKNRYLK